MKSHGLLRYVTFGSVLGAIAILALLLLVWGLVLRGLAQQPSQAPQPEPTAIIQVILAPTATPPPADTPLPPTPTTTASSELNTPAPNTGMKIGDYVQISGTGGDGLRIRSGPGIGNPPLFLGMESEVFKVVDGPKDADGLTWYNLVAPYDENRKGWAASNYLTVIAKQP